MEDQGNRLPRLIEGGLAVDDRGQLSFVNDFGFNNVKRFYMVHNHIPGFVRAWHGHKHEAKYVFVANGAAIVGAVEIDHWEKPSRTLHVHRYVLSANKPSILYIPPGYANGFKSLTGDMNIIFFSTATMEEAKNDDIRFDAHYWDVWDVVER